uniref:Uncharacterized protein n=1 Tax=Meloidogyne enterolobii TaxID=390850 RepID=A0A6V7WQE6_MELEN|nr:unnamed protein product [Meloidogyne enterolobii]
MFRMFKYLFTKNNSNADDNLPFKDTIGRGFQRNYLYKHVPLSENFHKTMYGNK